MENEIANKQGVESTKNSISLASLKDSEMLRSNITVLIGGIIFISVLLSFLSPYFFRTSNLTNIALQSSINGILAIGMTFVILTAGIDLSVGSILSFSGVVLGWSLNILGVPVPIALLLCVSAGGLCGLANGLFVAKGKVPPFIVTVGMMGIAQGMALVITGGRPISGFDQAVVFLGSGRIAGVPIPFIIMIVCYIIAYYVLHYTKFGRYVFIIGGNQEAARLSGINVDKFRIFVYIICGMTAGIASIIMTGRLNSANAIAGMGLQLDAIAAVIIGGTSFSGGEGFIVGTLLGAILMTIIRNGMNLLNVSSHYQQIVIGLIIIFAVMSDTLRKSRA